MKRRAKDILEGPPRKMPSISTENFDFLELSICPTKVEVEENDVPHSTIDETAELPDFSRPVTMETFKQILSSRGPCVKNVRIVSGNRVLLPCVAKYCKNVDRIELLEGEGSDSLEHFRRLTEMKVPHVRMATHVFEKCLTNNPKLESLEFDHYWYREDIKDLKLFPKLRYLRLIEMAMGEDGSAQETKNGKPKKTNSTPFDYTIVLRLLRSKTLTNFSFESEKNCNQLIQLLASHKPNLEKLSFTMNVNKQTFADIGGLKNLKVLAMTATVITVKKVKRTIGIDASKLPKKLACLTLNNIAISGTQLLSIVHLPLLDELYIGTTSARLHPWLRDTNIVPDIQKILEKGRRILKIFFSDAGDKIPYKYQSANLEIINECAVNTAVKPLHIMISS